MVGSCCPAALCWKHFTAALCWKLLTCCGDAQQPLPCTHVSNKVASKLCVQQLLYTVPHDIPMSDDAMVYLLYLLLRENNADCAAPQALGCGL